MKNLQQLKKYLKDIFKKDKSQLLTNMLIVGIVTVVVKVISFYKEILIAKEYGVSELLDTFLIAILVPSFIQSVFINAYSSVFIPNYLLEKDKQKDTSAFQTSSYIITFTIAIVMILITYLGINIYLELLFPGHETVYYDLIKAQIIIILPCIIFWAFSSLTTGLLMTDNEYLLSSTNAIFIPLGVIFALFFHNQLAEKTLAIGTLGGSILSFIYLLIIGFKKRLIKLGKPDFRSANMKVLLKQIPAKITSGLINGVNPMIDQYFSAQLTLGAIAALNYGYKIPMVTIGLISGPIGNTVLPYFSGEAVKSISNVYLKLKEFLKKSFIATAILTIFLIILSKPIIIAFFERGAFTSENTDLVYLIQQMYFIQIPFYIVGVIMNKYLTAINKNNFLVVSSILSFLLNISLNYTLLEIIGIKGLALATSLVSVLNSLVIYLYIKYQYENSINV
ncbi:murein biosynthesis integral membrane protein MurJ [Maribacter sp. Asnod1-A12]|uniref:murein biosynthesis integral membrane protein MurJ n=1 Tax=Maribacter sp. Asnod1-A12 TaxID=3160576 RepID=UPI00386D1988